MTRRLTDGGLRCGAAHPGIEGKEVGPRLLQFEPHMLRIRRLHRGDPLLHQALAGTTIALEGELHVAGCNPIAIVERGAVAQDEFVGEAVL
jgi:hypothetical protein